MGNYGMLMGCLRVWVIAGFPKLWVFYGKTMGFLGVNSGFYDKNMGLLRKSHFSSHRIVKKKRLSFEISTISSDFNPLTSCQPMDPFPKKAQ